MRQVRVRGLTLIEVLVTLAIVAVGIALVIERSAAASRDQRRQQFVQGIQQWMDTTRNAYAEFGAYTGATTTDLNRFAPQSWQVGTSVLPPIGGSITPMAVTYLSLPGGGVQLSHSLLPQVDCGAVAADLQRDFVLLTINATALKSTSAATFTRAQADAACVRNSNTFIGVFK